MRETYWERTLVEGVDLRQEDRKESGISDGRKKPGMWERIYGIEYLESSICL
jgi:hypothetical protein